MELSSDWLSLGFQILQALLTLCIGIYVYVSNKNKVTEDDFDERLDRHGLRITKLETRAENSPTHDDLKSIHEKVNQVNTNISTLSGEFSGVRNLLNTIHHHLLENGK